MQGVEYTSDEKNDLKRKILEAFMDGVNITLTAACQKAGVGRTSVYGWRDEDAEFKAAIRQAQLVSLDNGLDLAENKLMKKIYEEDRKSIFYFLDRRGTDRGYNPKLTTITTGPDGLPLPPADPPVFNISFPDKADAPTPAVGENAG